MFGSVLLTVPIEFFFANYIKKEFLYYFQIIVIFWYIWLQYTSSGTLCPLKTAPLFCDDNFVKYWPIFTILLLLESLLNFLQNYV